MSDTFAYTSSRWRALADQARARDGARCSVSRLFGGGCSTRLDVHHLIPVTEDETLAWDLDNLLTVCSKHHRFLEAMRRYVMRDRKVKPCRHNHRYDHARRECAERRAQAA